MKRLFQQFRNDWPSYIFEILVIIIGITISFWVNEWRIANEERDSEKRLIHEFHENLAADSLNLFTDMKLIETGLPAYDTVINTTVDWQSFPKDSIGKFLQFTSIYFTFLSNDMTYEEIKQSGLSRLISNKPLLADIINLYHVDYLQIREINKIESTFILNRMLPFLDSQLPVHVTDLFLESREQQVIHLSKLLKNQHFINLLKSNYVIKLTIIKAYDATLQKLRNLIRQLKTEEQNL